MNSSRLLALGLSTAFSLAACGDGGSSPTPPPALEITARTPAPNATEVETGAAVTVTFNQAIDPATLTAATFIVKGPGGTALPVALTYDAATRTAKASAPFVPKESYGVEVTTGVRTLADSALGAAAVWSFTMREWKSVIVDNANVAGLYTSLALDSLPRVSYHDGTVGDLKYIACVKVTDCTTPPGVIDSWIGTTVEATGFVGSWTSLAVDASGRSHVSYFASTGSDLKYATCAAACHTSSANWQTVTVDTTGSVGTFTSLAVQLSGRVHLTYHDITNGNLKYATCAGACAIAANWQVVTVDTTGSVGQYTSLAVETSGRLHVTYADDTNADLKYATCAAGCTTAANWQTATVDGSGAAVGSVPSVAVGAGGRLHVTYYDGTNDDLKYATCGAACGTAANWQVVTVDGAGLVGQYSSLAVDGNGRLHVSYFDGTNFDLKYATCAVACATAGNWRFVAVDPTGSVGEFTSLAVDGSGRLHVSYYDVSNSALKYIE